MLEIKRDDKQEMELFMAGAVLKGMNISNENCISCDRPDIIVPKDNNEAIGIEVVSYRVAKNAESKAALNKEVLSCNFTHKLPFIGVNIANPQQTASISELYCKLL